MIKIFSKFLQRTHKKLDLTCGVDNFNGFIKKPSMPFFNNLNFSFSTNLTNQKSKNNSKISESEINKLIESVINFKPKTISKSGDAVVINFKKSKRLNEDNMYTVFQSKGKYFILKNSVTCLIIGITLGMTLYLTFKWFKNELKIYRTQNRNFLTCVAYFVIFAIFSIISIMFLRNYRYRAWKFIKRIELSRDLKKLSFLTLLNRRFEEDLSNVYLYYNYTPYYHSFRTMTKVNDTLILGIKKKIYIISLEDADIPDLDLFSCCVRGYKLKAL